MSGHNKWSQIKHKKAAKDQKRSNIFSRLVKEITIAARGEANPEFNPRLKAAVLRAKAANMPNDNIERAIKKASESKELEEMTIEAYGPGGIAIIADVITDNKNRTIPEIKHLLSENNGKLAESGSLDWAFSAKGGSASGGEKLEPKFPQEIQDKDKERLQKLLEKLEENDDISTTSHNAKL
ncbi:YebC/PmpR family DNA-binding transcriptional regulator [bacterium]|nr:YebC/PmpR family DNA-binding transcriptional regulator [bacterium]|tara:strand:+ start:292 stop:837 length:546 start_codon:yes stop_codon:yes gene_type:complete